MKPNLLILISFAAALLGSSLSAEAQGPTATPAPAGELGAKAALSKTELRKLIENTEWVTGKKPQDDSEHIFFNRGGKITGSGRQWWNFYTLEAPDILKIYEADPAKNRKAPFFQYRVNVAAKTAEFDDQASTKPGAGQTMKYVGPAPKK